MKREQIKTVKIKSGAEMLEFIETSNLEVESIKILLHKAYGIIISGKETKQEIVNQLRKYLRDAQFKRHGYTIPELPNFPDIGNRK